MGVSELAQLTSWEVALMQKPKNVTVVLMCTSSDSDLQEECQTFASDNSI